MSRHDYAIREAVEGLTATSKGWVRASCPVCESREGTPDRKVSFGLNARTGWYQCYRCGVRGKLDGFEVLERAEGLKPPCIELPDEFVLLEDPNKAGMLLSQAWRFLLDSRRMTFEEITDNRIGACISGRFSGRVVIPVFDENGMVVWFVARTWFKKAEKPYLYPLGDRNGAMWNGAALQEKTDVPAIIVEGCFDAIPYYPNAVAALGKITADSVVDVLSSASRPVVFAPDGDECAAGWAAAQRLRLRGHRAGSIQFAPKVDPDEIFPRAKLVDAAVASLDTQDSIRVT